MISTLNPTNCISMITLIFVSGLIIVNVVHYYSYLFNTPVLIIKLTTLTILFVTLFLSIISWKWGSYPICFDNLYQTPQLNANLSLPLVMLSIFITITCLLFSWYSEITGIFLCNVLLILCGSIANAFATNNLFLFLLYFELSSLPIFVLLAYSGSARRERINALYYFLFFTLYGSISLLLVLVSIYAMLSMEAGSISSFALIDEKVLWVLMFSAFAIKMPLFPLHIWLPYAHVEASTITSVLLAALLLKLGGYGLIQFMLPTFQLNTHLYYRPLVMFLCVIGVIYASFCAMRQLDLKRQVAFSSIAHMNFAAVGIFTLTDAGIAGAVYMMLSHGLISALYFFLVGMLAERFHTRSVMAFSGLWGGMPVLSAFLLVVTLANIGLPGLSGFIPEFLILTGIMENSLTIMYPILFGLIITTVASLIVILRVLFGHLKIVDFNGHYVDMTRIEFTISISLVLFIIVLGVTNIFI